MRVVLSLASVARVVVDGGGDCDMNAAECKEPGELSMTVNGTGKWSA